MEKSTMANPKILIAFATTHGQTEKIAAAIGQAMERRGCLVTIANVKARRPPHPNQFDGVVVGASIIARGHQPAVEAFIRDYVATLNLMPTAFFSVSASAGSSLEKGRAAARRVRDEFLLHVGFRPALSECIAGAIKYTRYNILLRWYMKKASRMNGGSTDTSRDHEYTDWNQVASFAQEFTDLVDKRASIPSLVATR
jgi:menaquinone-dependent protoporphyrinogen oxidase